MTPESCPNCGAEVPSGATACPECGSSAETGWSESADADRLGLPDESFNYEEFIESEFGARPSKRSKAKRFWRGVAVVMLTAMVIGLCYSLLK
ncbi:MAG: zinc-ribbon domain-containing protein [Verrucomicrobiota bacterium]